MQHKNSTIGHLKPCPFCKQSVLTILPNKSEDDGFIYAYHVYCKTCGTSGRNRHPIGWCETPESAAEAWNDRGEPEVVSAYSIKPHLSNGEYAIFKGEQSHSAGRPICVLSGFLPNQRDADVFVRFFEDAINVANNNKLKHPQ